MTVLIKICNENATPTVFWFGPTLAFLISKPEDIKAVYMSPNCLAKPYVYDFFGGLNALFTSKPEMWKKDRRVINGTFNKRILQSFVPIFNENVEWMVEQMRERLGGGVFDVGEPVASCTLSMVVATTLGMNAKLERAKIHEFLTLLEE